MKATKAKPEQPETIVRLYKTKEACALWGISHYTLRQMVLSGHIKPVTSINGVPLKGWMFNASDLKPDMLEYL